MEQKKCDSQIIDILIKIERRRSRKKVEFVVRGLRVIYVSQVHVMFNFLGVLFISKVTILDRMN